MEVPPRPAWKEEILGEFAGWLAELEEGPRPADMEDGPPKTAPPDHPPGERMEDDVELLSLFSEFSVLRQEVRMQNREQRRAVEAMGALSDLFREKTGELASAAELMAARMREETVFEAALGRLRREIGETVRREAEKRVLSPFLDVRDALVRGLEATAPAGTPRLSRFSRLFRRAPPEQAEQAENLREGYEMALRKYDRALAAAGIHPVEAAGKPFDPHLMRAVEMIPGGDAPPGIVLEERLCGFVRGEEVFRPAEVAVSAGPPEETDSPAGGRE